MQRFRCGKGSEVKKFRGSEEQSQGGVVVQRCRGEKGSECRGAEVKRCRGECADAEVQSLRFRGGARC